MTNMKVVEFTGGNLADIPSGLRAIADGIESGKYGTPTNLAWVLDCGDSSIEVGLLGIAPEGGIFAHYLFALAQRRMEEIMNTHRRKP